MPDTEYTVQTDTVEVMLLHVATELTGPATRWNGSNEDVRVNRRAYLIETYKMLYETVQEARGKPKAASSHQG